MLRLSHRFAAAFAAVAGFAGLASAQNIVASSLPNIPIAPALSQPAPVTQLIQQAQAIVVPQQAPQPGAPQQQAPQTGIAPKSAVLPQTATAPGMAPAIGAMPLTGPVMAPGYPGCYNCAQNAVSADAWSRRPQNVAFGVGLAPIPYNEYCSECANGCGSLKSDFGFVFGSCKNFFNPCGPKPCGSCAGGCGAGGCGGGCGGLFHHCPTFPLGKPYGSPHNGCCYDSYANH